MKLGKYPNRHLTYCTNIHPGESWAEVFDQLKTNIPELKNRLSPEKPFGIGLRLSAEAAEDLMNGDRLQEFKKWLRKEDTYVFTMNGFPYGSFHGEVVKDNVYKPDWQTNKRVNYTLNLAHILAELLPAGMDGGISTSPLSYKYWFDDASGMEEVFQQSTEHLAQVAWQLDEIRDASGKEIHIDIEPEPDCILENSHETISFFKDWLFPLGSQYLSTERDISKEKAIEIIQNHISVCYDTCHFAVEYEDPKEAIQAIQRAGIRIGKTQISAALKIGFEDPDQTQSIVSKLKAFEERTYLHQVVEMRADGSRHQYRDLPDAFGAISDHDPKEWRIHYHVPIFVDEFDGLHSTQDDIIKSLKVLLESSDCTHYEIETYTWGVLPDNLKTNLRDSIEREFRWTLSQIDSVFEKT